MLELAQAVPAPSFGAGELAILVSFLVTCLVGLLAWNGKGAVHRLDGTEKRLAVVETDLAVTKAQAPHARIDSLEKELTLLRIDATAIKADVRYIRSQLESGPHRHRRSTDPEPTETR